MKSSNLVVQVFSVLVVLVVVFAYIVAGLQVENIIVYTPSVRFCLIHMSCLSTILKF